MASDGTVLTFYSYKGGTGRSMALANVGWILATNGKRVLVIDWDLEAPGLHRYFHPFLTDPQLASTDGVIDFVTDFSVRAMAAADSREARGRDWYVPLANLAAYTASLTWAFPTPGTLDFVSAGRQDSSYATRVTSFDWGAFYERYGGGVFLDAAIKQAKRDYDYILIDSRTGVSDTAGICTVQLPDTLVVCFTLNTQSIEGAAAVTSSVVTQRTRPITIFPVPMRVEPFEKQKMERRLEYARTVLTRHLPPQTPLHYWGDVQVTYSAFYAYEEILAPFGDRAGEAVSMLASAERLSSYLTKGTIQRLEPIPESNRLAVLERFSPPTGPGRSSPRVEDDPRMTRLRDLALQFWNSWRDTPSGGPLLTPTTITLLRAQPAVLEQLLIEPDFASYWHLSTFSAEVEERHRQWRHRDLPIYAIAAILALGLAAMLGATWWAGVRAVPGLWGIATWFMAGMLGAVVDMVRDMLGRRSATTSSSLDEPPHARAQIAVNVLAGGMVGAGLAGLFGDLHIEPWKTAVSAFVAGYATRPLLFRHTAVLVTRRAEKRRD